MDPLTLALLVLGLALALGAGWAGGRYMRVGQAERRADAAARDAEAAHAAVERDRADLARQRTEADQAAADLAARRERHEQRVAEAQAARAADREAIDAARTQLQATRATLDARRARLDATEAALLQGTEALDTLAAEAETRRTEATKLAETVKARAAEVAGRQQAAAAREKDLDAREAEIARTETRLTALVQEHLAKLEAVGGISRDEARRYLVSEMEREAKLEAARLVQDARETARQTADREAKKLIIKSVQRLAAPMTVEHTVSPIQLPREDMKGRVIGREGRNIRAFEAATGVEVVVDDTPDAVLVSAFEPVRREVARLSMEKLLADGRIHPARIEEVVEKTRSEIEEEIVETGEQAALELELHGLHPELIRLVGRMRYRASYGQNLLAHSVEVAKLASVMASELGLDARRARRAGLLHDIGKVVEEPIEQPHAIVGMEIAMRYKEHPDIANAIGAHHDEVPMSSLIAPLVQAADAASGARPGARREALERYVQRLHDLETIATSYEGVQQAYAIQAGRELRVIVSPEAVTDALAESLARDISNRIEREVEYPGQIRVTVIREVRSVSVAT
ncbi:MAG: ribonuclease Y [Bacteroidota bacterium]